MLRVRGTDFVGTIYLIFSAYVILTGYILSAFNHLGEILAWAWMGLLVFSLVVAVAIIMSRGTKNLISKVNLESYKRITSLTTSSNGIERAILILSLSTFFVTMVLNFLNVVLVAPNNWDSMTYHLARVAYYLQNGHLGFYEANYWAQVVHPKNSSLLLLYSYLVSDRNENLTKLVQFLSYVVAVFSLYGISRQLKFSPTIAVLAACTGGLLINWLMEATTNQNDLIITAYFGFVIYFMLRYLDTLSVKHLLLSSLSLALSVGIKASALIALPALGLVILGGLCLSRQNLAVRFRALGCFVFSFMAFCFLFVLPAGYWENYVLYSNPLGPKEVAESHGFTGKPLSYILKNGLKNVIRYGFEFLTLDGFPVTSEIRKIQTAVKFLPRKLVVDILDIDIENSEGTRASFRLNRMPIAHEDFSYWGILGIGVVWPAVLYSIFKPSSTRYNLLRVFGLATVIFIFSQGFAGPYDPWRGRYFTTAVIFAIPTTTLLFCSKQRLMKIYLLGMVLLGCFSAIHAVVYKGNNNLLPISTKEGVIPSILSLGRLEQMTTNHKEIYQPLVAFESLVPANARVAVYLPPDSYEYPLFGEKLTRVIYPINSFLRGYQGIPIDAQYLLYSIGFPDSKQEDIPLGNGLYLRSLDQTNQEYHSTPLTQGE